MPSLKKISDKTKGKVSFFRRNFTQAKERKGISLRFLSNYLPLPLSTLTQPRSLSTFPIYRFSLLSRLSLPWFPSNFPRSYVWFPLTPSLSLCPPLPLIPFRLSLIFFRSSSTLAHFLSKSKRSQTSSSDQTKPLPSHLFSLLVARFHRRKLRNRDEKKTTSSLFN